MKAFRIVLVSIFVLIILVVVGTIVFISTIDINKYKSQIKSQLETVLRREVALGNLNLAVSLSQGVVLNVQGFQIKDDVEFSKENFFSVDRVQLALDVMALIQKREIVVSRVEIVAPQIAVIKNKAGRLNIPMMPSTEEKAGSSVPASGTTTPQSPPSAQQKKPEGSPALPALSVSAIDIKNGSLRFVDQAQSPEMSVEIKNINLNVNHFSLTEPFKFLLTFSLWSAADILSGEGKEESQSIILTRGKKYDSAPGKYNFSLSGSSKIDLATNQVEIKDLNFKSDLSSLSLSALRQSVPQLNTLPVEIGNELKGNLLFSVSQGVVGPAGLSSLSGQGELSSAQVIVNKIPVALSSHFLISEKDFDLSDLTIGIDSGTIVVTGKIGDYLKSQSVALAVSVQQIPLEPFVASVNPQIKFTGAVDAQTQITLDSLQNKNPAEAVQGNGQMIVKDGQLKQTNLLNLILGQIPMLPNLLQNLIEQNIPEQYKTVLNQEHTIFQKIESDFDLQQGLINISRMELQSDAFSLSGKASLDLQQNMGLEMTLFIAKELSASMVDSVKELQGLLEQDGRIKIPLIPYQGKAASYKPIPDVEYLGKRILVNRGVQEIKKWLGDALERNAPSTPAQQPQNGQSPSDEKQPAPEEQLLDNILNKVFK